MADVFETTDYIVRGDTHSNGSTNPLAAQFSALANGVGTGDQTPTDSELLLTCVNGAWYVKAFSALWDYINSKLSTNTPSHIGQIIHSTTLATLEDVQAIYGSDTTWIQHTGYILRGASSGVTENSAVKDGGEDTHTLTTNEMPAHTHGSKTLTGSFRLSPSVTLNTANSYPMYDSFTGICSQRVDYTQQAYTGTSVAPNGNRITGATINATHEHDSVGGGVAHNNMQSYKNVYIWERVS